MKKAKQPKKVSYELIPREGDVGAPMYALLDTIVHKHHEDLHRTNARVALAWCTSWKADVDGHVVIGKCKKASDLDRELAAFDFVILLSKAFWYIATQDQRAALLDHECMHAALKYDPDGDPTRDERGRYVYRTRKHDVEEFGDVITRHGMYKRDLEQFVKAVDRARARVGHYAVGYTTLAARLEHAGLPVPVEAIVFWSEHERRQALEWCELRRELMKADPGAAARKAPPDHVAAAVSQGSLLERRDAGDSTAH
jgi:hypothetical protein